MDNLSLKIDKRLINNIIDGDQIAFKRLFDKYYDYAFEVATLYCSFHEAEEVVSDVFSKIWNNRSQLAEVSSFKGYLFMSLKNQCLNYLRKKKIDTVDIEHLFDSAAMQESSPQQILESNELTESVEEVIENLPPKCKEAFKLVREDGLKYKEAAKQLSITENTLDVHLKKATKRILEVIRNYGKIIVLMFFIHFK